MKRILLASTIAISLIGCSKQANLTPWWTYYDLPGYFPLTSGGSKILLQGHQAFIKSNSVLVDCRGALLPLGEGTVLYLLKGGRVGVYSQPHKQVRVIYNLAELAGVYGTVNGRFQRGYSVEVDLALAGTIAAEQPQCSYELEFAAKRY